MEKKRFLPEVSIVIIVGIVLIILAAGISYFIAMQFAGSGDLHDNKGSINKENGEPVPEIGKTYELEEFTTNISNDGRRMLQVEIVLELAEGSATSELEEKRTPIRDSIISVIRDQTMEDLDSGEGVDQFQHDIKEAINYYLGDGEVINVYFDSFIIT